MKKFSIFVLLALFVVPAFAAAPSGTAPQPSQNGEHMKNGPKGKPDFMANLTEAQKACLENTQKDCPKMPKPDMGNPPAPGEKPAPGKKPKRPELTAEQKAEMDAARECQRKAFETCGIEMPARPEKGGKGGKGPKSAPGNPPAQ